MEYFKEYLIIKGYSKKTIGGQIAVVLRFKKWAEEENLPEESTSYNDVLAYVKSLKQKGVKQRTVQLYINGLKHYFTFLQNEVEVMADNPAEYVQVKGIKRQHLYDLFTEEELDEIYQQYQVKGAAGRRNKNILGLIIYQGLKGK